MMQITEALERRTIEYVIRNDDGITLVCTDGHEIALHVVDGEIHFKGQNVKVYLEPLSFGAEQGLWV